MCDGKKQQSYRRYHKYKKFHNDPEPVATQTIYYSQIKREILQILEYIMETKQREMWNHTCKSRKNTTLDGSKKNTCNNNKNQMEHKSILKLKLNLLENTFEF